MNDSIVGFASRSSRLKMLSTRRSPNKLLLKHLVETAVPGGEVTYRRYVYNTFFDLAENYRDTGLV